MDETLSEPDKEQFMTCPVNSNIFKTQRGRKDSNKSNEIFPDNKNQDILQRGNVPRKKYLSTSEKRLTAQNLKKEISNEKKKNPKSKKINFNFTVDTVADYIEGGKFSTHQYSVENESKHSKLFTFKR